MQDMSPAAGEQGIAALLHITEDTVTVHLQNIFAKLEVNERISVNVAVRRGIVHRLEHLVFRAA